MSLAMKFEAMIAGIARKLYKQNRFYCLEDLIQVGLMTAVRVENSFDSEIAKPSTYLTICVRRGMTAFICKHKRMFRESKAPFDRGEPERFHLPDYLPTMSDLDRSIIELVFAKYSHSEISDILEIPIEIITSASRRIKRKIRINA